MDNLALRHTLHKEERICSRKTLEALFSGGQKSMSSFPIRAVFMHTEEEGVRVLFSVSKRHFKRAVHRNRVKRQLREAYRLNKQMLTPLSGGLNIAFLWGCNEILPSAKVTSRMQHLLLRINEAITSPQTSL